jgi:calcineurin-like phosphoesterase
MNEIKSKNIDFVIVNGENAAPQGVGLTKEICHDFFNCGVDVITTWKSCVGPKRNNGVYR